MQATTTQFLTSARIQQVDLQVSRSKFDRELADFIQAQTYHKQRGIVLLGASFPFIQLAFYAYRARPILLAFTVQLDFTNYDVEPPSLRFIDFLTGNELTQPALNIEFTRYQKIIQPNGVTAFQPLMNLIQSHQPDQIPFVCIPGLYEYHQHPAHSDDPWLLRRDSGEGRLGFIIDQLHTYGTEAIHGIIPQLFSMRPVNPPGMLIHFQGVTFLKDKTPL